MEKITLILKKMGIMKNVVNYWILKYYQDFKPLKRLRVKWKFRLTFLELY